MSRATVYLFASGAVWLAEGYIFSVLLDFHLWQTLLLVGVYALLWIIAAMWLLRLLRWRGSEPQLLPVWRHLSLAPMLTATLGSFVSLPIVVAIAALGKLG